jgi:outer membrane protein TolC
MKQFILFIGLLGGVITGSYAQQAPAANQTYNFTLADCINYAYAHQDTVLNASLDVKSAEYKVKETTGIGLPQVSGSAGFQDYIKIPVTLIPGAFFGQPGTFVPLKFGVKYQSNLTLAASQLLFDGTYLVGLQASKTYKELSQRAYKRSKIEVNVTVTKAYYQVLVSGEQIKLLDANLAQLKQQLDETIAENKQGFVEQIDVQRLTVQYNNLVTTRENTVRLLSLYNQLLKFQMGMPIENNLELTDKLENVNLDSSEAAVISDSTLYRNRVEYGLLETQKNLYELDVKRIKATFLPSLSANANLTSSYQNNNFNSLYSSNYPSSFIGLSLNVPIFNGLQRHYQLRESQITVMKTKNDLDNLKNGLNLQAVQARINYINGLKSLENQKESQALAREVLRVAKIKYKQGVGSSIEVTQAQAALESADNQYIQGLFQALVSKVDLDRVYGKFNNL